MEKKLSDDQLKHWAVRCLKQVVDNLDKINSNEWPTLKDKVYFKAAEIGFKPGNCQKIAERAMVL